MATSALFMYFVILIFWIHQIVFNITSTPNTFSNNQNILLAERQRQTFPQLLGWHIISHMHEDLKEGFFQECLSVSQYYIINNIIMITIFLARSCWLVELWACSISTKENSTLSNILSANPYNHSKVRLHQLVCKHQQQNFYSVSIHFCACHSLATRKLYFISSSALPVQLHPQHFIKIIHTLPSKSRKSNCLGNNHDQFMNHRR